MASEYQVAKFELPGKIAKSDGVLDKRRHSSNTGESSGSNRLNRIGSALKMAWIPALRACSIDTGYLGCGISISVPCMKVRRSATSFAGRAAVASGAKDM